MGEKAKNILGVTLEIPTGQFARSALKSGLTGIFRIILFHGLKAIGGLQMTDVEEGFYTYESRCKFCNLTYRWHIDGKHYIGKMNARQIIQWFKTNYGYWDAGSERGLRNHLKFHGNEAGYRQEYKQIFAE